ncbi:hypothetical protein [Desulforamulus reducens]|uniref:hypothetical protein n=1 Tax=Desulforamulus reducens TaxID=59610 RepID=UPI0012EADD82|nr:hypothetical protein [Desulforamulus reducens]
MVEKCSICNKETTRVLECSVCGEEVCSSCHEQCSVCGQWACHKHIVCLNKKLYVCSNCYAEKIVDSLA